MKTTQKNLMCTIFVIIDIYKYKRWFSYRCRIAKQEYVLRF